MRRLVGLMLLAEHLVGRARTPERQQETPVLRAHDALGALASSFPRSRAQEPQPRTARRSGVVLEALVDRLAVAVLAARDAVSVEALVVVAFQLEVVLAPRHDARHPIARVQLEDRRDREATVGDNGLRGLADVLLDLLVQRRAAEMLLRGRVRDVRTDDAARVVVGRLQVVVASPELAALPSERTYARMPASSSDSRYQQPPTLTRSPRSSSATPSAAPISTSSVGVCSARRWRSSRASALPRRAGPLSASSSCRHPRSRG
jgi:hypothetical protein